MHCESLHPFWLSVAFVLAMTGCSGEPTRSVESPQSAEPQVTVRVAPVEQRRIVQTIEALGRCEALPSRSAILTLAVEGQVSETLVEQGRRVTKGQTIVQLDRTLAEADLAEKRAARDSLSASLALLESQPRAQEQQAAKLAIDQAEIVVARAAALVERLKPLRDRNELPEQQMYEAEQALKQAEVQRDAAQAQFDVLMLRPRQEAIDESQSKIKVADQAVGAAQARLNLHAIRAPIDGVLDSLTCRPGQTISIGTSIGEVVDSSRVMAVAWMSPVKAHSVNLGQKAVCRASVPKVPSDANSEASLTTSGRVEFIGQVADAQTGNVPVHVLIDNPTGRFVVGQMFAVTIALGDPSPTLAAPEGAIHDEGEGPVVTVVRDGKARQLRPTLGQSNGGWIAVLGTDLRPGEPVVLEGAYNLPDDTPVVAQPVDRP